MLAVLTRVPVNRQEPLAKGLLGVAGCIALLGVVFVMAFTERTETTGHLFWKETTELSLSERLPWLLVGIGMIAVAAVCVVAAIRLTSIQGSLKKYPPILTGVESMKIQQIADITNSNRSKVYRDIQILIDSGAIDDFYIDYKAEQVVSRKYIPKSSHKTVVKCGGCGANNELIVGVTRTCGSCGEPLVLRKS